MSHGWSVSDRMKVKSRLDEMTSRPNITAVDLAIQFMPTLSPVIARVLQAIMPTTGR